jgi:hypothetical protein
VWVLVVDLVFSGELRVLGSKTNEVLTLHKKLVLWAARFGG